MSIYESEQTTSGGNTSGIPRQRLGFHDMLNTVAGAERPSQIRAIRPGLFEAVRKGELSEAQMEHILAFSDVQLGLIDSMGQPPETPLS